MHFEDSDLFDWNNWVSKENKLGKCETIIYIVTLPEKAGGFFSLSLLFRNEYDAFFCPYTRFYSHLISVSSVLHFLYSLLFAITDN